jgi:hypothetical protein
MNMKLFFNHLMRRRRMIWIVTLLLMIGFTGAAGVILWSVRMKVTYRAEIRQQEDEGRDGSLTAIIPAADYQLIIEGEQVIITLAEGTKLEGSIASVTTETNKIKLEITALKYSEETAEALITLRAQRLIAAFLQR